METERQKEHEWLHRLAGEWRFEGEAAMAPDKPVETFRGTEAVRSIGGLWTLGEGRSEMPEGGEATTIMTLGYDPQRKRFVGTFIASMMTHLWVYDGSLDAEGKVLTLDTEGPDMGAEGRMTKFQDLISFENDDHRVLSSRMLATDGTWRSFMTAHYRRTR